MGVAQQFDEWTPKSKGRTALSKKTVRLKSKCRSVAAKVEHSGGFETSCPVKLKTCGFETTKTTSAS
jgi:hypothetical protein